MPDLIEQMYCSEQIPIPPNLPSILKKYAKAAIRTQPYDLLVWSAAYFKAIADGIVPPSKLRLEYPPPKEESGLSPGFLKVLIHQLGKDGTVKRSVIADKWKGVCLPYEQLSDIMKLGQFGEEVDWQKFIAIAAGTLEPNLTRTMILICELLTEEPEGGSAMIPFETFTSLYKYLALLDCGPKDSFQPPPPPEEEKPIPPMEFTLAKSDDSISDKTWDSVIRGIGTEDSEVSVATSNMEEHKLDAGFKVLADPACEGSSTETVILAQPSDEGVTSAYGMQIWDGGEHDIQEVTEIKQSTLEAVPVEQSVSSGLEDPEEVEVEEKFIRPSVLEMERKFIDEDEIPPSASDIEAEKKSEESIFIDDVEEKGTLEIGEKTHQGKPESPKNEIFPNEATSDLITIVEPSDSAPPNTVSSANSSLSYERPMKDITTVSEISVGQRLGIGQSVMDVRTGMQDSLEKDSEEEGPTAPYWLHIPGIGPAVPPSYIGPVIIFFTACAESQEGMIMPRNLRHFLCPPLYEEAPEKKSPDQYQSFMNLMFPKNELLDPNCEE